MLLVSSLASWAVAAADGREEKKRAQMLELEEKNRQFHKENVLRRVTKHWKSRALSKMFNAWTSKAVDSARARSMCKRAALRITNMRAASAFMTWDVKASQSVRYKVCA